MKFMNLPEEYCKGNFAVVSIPFEGNVTYGKGSYKGCKEILEASKHLEYYDEQFDVEPFIKGIESIEILSEGDEKQMIKDVCDKFPKDKFVVSLGGDHSITQGCVKAINNEFDVIVFDAHSDLRDSWNDSMNNHACVSKRISEKHDMLLLGIRSQDVDEVKEKPENVTIIKAYDINKEKLKVSLDNLKEKVYISIDVDVFDPSFIRNTGTPEPGGFMWNEMIEYLKIIFEHKNVISCDIVEFCPKENYRAEAYTLAKLCYKLMSMKLTLTN